MAIFDTHAYVQRLRKGGVVAKQAGAHSEGLHEVLKNGVATSTQFQALDTRLAALQREIQLNRWLLVFVIAWMTLLDFL